jgi:hypothetical protein
MEIKIMAGVFSWKSYLVRLFFAFVIVFSTYNPSTYSYAHWVISDINQLLAVKALVGIILLIGWVIYIRATLRSLGFIGIILATTFFGLLFWLLIDLKIISTGAVAIQYMLLVILSFVISTGVSWSHIRRRITGQLDVDDVET